MKLSVMDNNNNGTFWPSYVDVMTTLFAIMLVLFAVSFSRFKIKEKELTQKVEELRDTETRLQEIVDEYSKLVKTVEAAKPLAKKKKEIDDRH